MTYSLRARISKNLYVRVEPNSPQRIYRGKRLHPHTLLRPICDVFDRCAEQFSRQGHVSHERKNTAYTDADTICPVSPQEYYPCRGNRTLRGEAAAAEAKQSGCTCLAAEQIFKVPRKDSIFRSLLDSLPCRMV